MNSVTADHVAAMVRYVRLRLRNLIVCCLIQGALLAMGVALAHWQLVVPVACLSLLGAMQGLMARAELNEVHATLCKEAER